MGVHRQVTIFLLAYFLLSACLCTQPTRSRRQKRGLIKMMMHVMWDPVRLIRYWYAYDVTKEIAKSWRKIIPTIMLLPVTQSSPHSYSGIAKYVHPTIKIRDSSKKKNTLKYYNAPVGSNYQESAGNVKAVAMPPALLHQILPSRYAYSQQQANQYHVSSHETEPGIQYDDKGVPQIIVGHVPYGDSKENGDQYSIAHYFIGDGNSKEQVSAVDGGALFPGHRGSNFHDDITSSSSQSVPRRKFKKRPYHKFSPFAQQNHVHYMPHMGKHGPVAQDDRSQGAPHILHPGQEFHIVLHPVPVSDFKPNYLHPPIDGRGVQFVPVHPHSNDSYPSNVGTAPVLFKAVSRNRQQSNTEEEEHTTTPPSSDDVSSIELRLDSSENSTDVNNSSSEAKSRVKWIAQKGTNTTRRKDQQIDLQPDETMASISSILTNSPQRRKFKKGGSTQNNPELNPSFSLNRKNINMERLREDLKHGTPVLIPFNKSGYSPDVESDSHRSSPVRYQSKANQPTNPHSLTEQSTNVQFENGAGMDSSAEHSGERNATQKVLLFLKRRKHS